MLSLKQKVAAAAVMGLAFSPSFVPPAPQVQRLPFSRSTNGAFRRGAWLRARRQTKRRQARLSRQINRRAA